MRNGWWAAPVLAAGAVVLAACGSSAAPTSTGSAPATHSQAAAPASGTNTSAAIIMTHSTSKGTVLTNSGGRTLYWFVIDTPSMSKCNGSCATFWPPVLGTPKAAPGTTLPHGFGTITRSDGKKQVTYDGHPLYTYSGDTAADQLNGNGVNASGGLWWAMTPTGAKVGATTTGGTAPSPSSSSSGGGYGY